MRFAAGILILSWNRLGEFEVFFLYFSAVSRNAGDSFVRILAGTMGIVLRARLDEQWELRMYIDFGSVTVLLVIVIATSLITRRRWRNPS